MGPMSFTVATAGTVQTDPSPSSSADGSALLSASMNLASSDVFDASFAGNIPIAGTLVFALGAVAKVRYVSIRSVDGVSLTLTIVSGRGTAVIPVSDLFLVRAKNAGDEISAVSVAGTGRVEYVIAGNKT